MKIIGSIDNSCRPSCNEGCMLNPQMTMTTSKVVAISLILLPGLAALIGALLFGLQFSTALIVGTLAANLALAAVISARVVILST